MVTGLIFSQQMKVLFPSVMVYSNQQGANMPSYNEKAKQGTACSTKPRSCEYSVLNTSEYISVKLCHVNVTEPQATKTIH